MDIEELLYTPEFIALISKSEEFYQNSDNPRKMREALNRGKDEKAWKLSGYTKNRFDERLDELRNLGQKIEERYDIEGPEEMAEEMDGEVDIDKEEYSKILDGESYLDFGEEYR